ncbi:MAG: hypothetical protein IJA10_13825 [Lachnospiraceae bacterium]|nr:hypothetical protein [Lachnospiraceae bacterium]
MKKMKKILFISMMSIFILLAGCGKEEEKVKTGVTAEVYFDAVVLEVNESSFLVEPKEESNEKKSADKIVVSRKNMEDEESLKIMEQIGVGDTVSIGYDGMIAETYPAQITALEITILNKADSSENVNSTKENVTNTTINESDAMDGEEFVRMVMLNDKLYVDTKETSSMLRCGNADFGFDSSVEKGKPTQNYQTNFGTGYAGQYSIRENRVEICIDDVWHVFAYQENDLEGVTMEVTENTKHTITMEIKNTTDSKLQYGDDYSLEKYEEDIDTWTGVPYLNSDIGFHDIAYPVEKGKNSTWSADWMNLYGELEEGKYRVVKEVQVWQESGEVSFHTLTAEFEIIENE